ncbi:MAG: hypothetical protein IT449_02650 [Phycisphaerales bacterium]|nr:hypothetical protein [Phycisphaerales bacterium]
MHRTPDNIRREGLKALRERLGHAGMICFLQQFETGHGDYAAERREWVDRITMDDIKQAARQPRRAQAKKKPRRSNRGRSS